MTRRSCFQIKAEWISGHLLNILDFLRNSKQTVALNGVTSSLENIHAGVPQDPVLGTLLFLIYININDLAETFP